MTLTAARNTLYFPAIYSAPSRLHPLGVQVDSVGWDYGGIDYTRYIVRDRTYQFNARWCECEKTRGVYTWPAYLDNNFWAVEGQPTILGTRTCPTWARLWPEYPGSPPKPEYWGDYAHWVCAAIERYSPAAVEPWNEPNSPVDEVPLAHQMYYGAWIAPEDPDACAAGAKYGSFLATVVPLIKQAWPAVKLLGGAINGNPGGLDFTRMAMGHGGNCVDGWSYHCYLHQGMTNYDRPFVYGDQLLALVGMPLYLTEMSVMGVEGAALDANQVAYLRYVRGRMAGWGLSYAGWYSLFNDWECTALIRDGQPKAVYQEWAR